MKGILWELHEAAGGGDVEKVLASTTKAYSRKPYGEKAWKAAAEYLVKQYGPVDAVKIMHHKAMRRAQDAASKNDVRSLVASVKSTVSTWPVKDILAEIGNSVSLAEEGRGGQQPLTTEVIFAAVTRIAGELGASVSKKGEFISMAISYDDEGSMKRYLKSNNLYDKITAIRNGKKTITYTFGNQ